MLKQVKLLGLVTVMSLGLNLVGCEDVDDVEIQDTNSQVQEQIDELTEEQKLDLIKNVAKNQAIDIMEEKGIDCLGLENAFDIMLAAMNDKNTTEAMGLDIETIKLVTAEGILEVANYNDGTMAEDIVRMCDYIVANNVEPENEDEYYMIMNGETWEDVIAYREEVQAIERASIEQYEKELRLKLFGIAATDISALYYDNGTNVKVEYKHIATGRKLGYIVIIKETMEYVDYIEY
jgi:hypothetical protein